MRGVKTGRNIQTTDSESARARKRAAFLANIRQASQAGLAKTHTEAPRRKRPTVVEVEVRPEPRRETVPTVPQPRRETVPTVARPRRETVHAVEQPKAAPRLFRDEALKHRLSYEEGRGLVRVSPPWTWALLWVVVSAVVAAVAASFVGEVEVTGRGRGIAPPDRGRARPHEPARRHRRPRGRALRRAGEVRGRPSCASSRRACRRSSSRRTASSRPSAPSIPAVSSQQDEHYAEQIENLNARAKRVAEQIASLAELRAATSSAACEADLGLLKKGLVSEMTVGESRDALAQAQRQLSGAEQTLDQTRQELASLEGRRQDELWNRRAAPRSRRRTSATRSPS